MPFDRDGFENEFIAPGVFGHKKMQVPDMLIYFGNHGYPQTCSEAEKKDVLDYLINFVEGNAGTFTNQAAKVAKDMNLRRAKRELTVAAPVYDAHITALLLNLVQLNDELIAKPGIVLNLPPKAPVVVAQAHVGAMKFLRNAAQNIIINNTPPADIINKDVDDLVLRSLKLNHHRQYFDEPTQVAGKERAMAASKMFSDPGMVLKANLESLIKLASDVPRSVANVVQSGTGTVINLPGLVTPRLSGATSSSKSIDRIDIDKLERTMKVENVFGDAGISKIEFKEDAAGVAGKIYGSGGGGGGAVYEFSSKKDTDGKWGEIKWSPMIHPTNIETEYYKMEEMSMIAMSMAAKVNQQLDEPQLNIIIEHDTGPNLILKLFDAANLGLHGCFEDKATQQEFDTEYARLHAKFKTGNLTEFETKLFEKAVAAIEFKNAIKADTNWDPNFICDVTRAAISLAGQNHILPYFEKQVAEAERSGNFSDESIAEAKRGLASSRAQYALRTGDNVSEGSKLKFENYVPGKAAETKRTVTIDNTGPKPADIVTTTRTKKGRRQ